MKTASILARVGICIVGLSSLWSIVAAPLSAYRFISVTTESMSYWLALFSVIAGGWLYLRNQYLPLTPMGCLYRCLAMVFAIAIIITAWHFADEQFFFFKMQSIPSEAWPRMVLDLKEMGKQASKSGVYSLSSRSPLPQSLQHLGLMEDYTGGMANVWNTSNYIGAVACVEFGHRIRCWGLCVGPEMLAKECCRGGTYLRVAPTAYFCFGSED